MTMGAPRRQVRPTRHNRYEGRLAAVEAARFTLPGAIRAGILAMVEAAPEGMGSLS
jgi:hypothetical protein